MNLLHDVDPGNKDEMNVIIEISKGSHNKYELNKETSLLELDRANYGAAAYPIEYGFVPQTLAEDGDAADILLLATYPIHPGAMVKMRPVAFMEMVDGGEPDNKIIGVPVKDQRWDDVQNLEDINKHTLQEIKNFFETLKQLKKKPVTVTVVAFKDKAAAQAEFEKARKMYEESPKGK